MARARFSTLDALRLGIAARIPPSLASLADAITPSRLAWLDQADEPASADAAFVARALGLIHEHHNEKGKP